MAATNVFIGSIESLLNDIERLSETQNPDVIDSMISRLQCASDTTNQLMHRSTSNYTALSSLYQHLLVFLESWQNRAWRTNHCCSVSHTVNNCRPIISGCDGPTERISAFLDRLLQPIAQRQASYLKDSTDFMNFIESTEVPKHTIIVSMYVTSLYTNIPQKEGIKTICKAYVTHYKDKPPIPTQSLERALRLISFHFMEKNYLQTHGTAMGTKVAVAFANIFMAKVETELLKKSAIKPICWKRYIDDIFSLWGTRREQITHFIEQANNHHATIKFTAEISEEKVTFLDTIVYKGKRFNSPSILDIRTHFKPTETFQYTHFTSCHPLGVKKGFIKGEALRLLRTNSSKEIFQKRLEEFQKHLRERGYQRNLITLTLSEIHFENRKEALRQKPSREKTILPFVTQYQPSVPSLKNIVMKHWQLIEKQPLLRQIYKEPPIISSHVQRWP